ncbi:hypothetical protein ACS0TY_001775 [Phlomoides rotata]
MSRLICWRRLVNLQESFLEVDASLKAKQIKSDVDEYLKTRQQGSPFLTELKQKLLLSPTDAARAGTRYNVPLINYLVLYVGMQVYPILLMVKSIFAHSKLNFGADMAN